MPWTNASCDDPGQPLTVALSKHPGWDKRYILIYI